MDLSIFSPPPHSISTNREDCIKKHAADHNPICMVFSDAGNAYNDVDDEIGHNDCPILR